MRKIIAITALALALAGSAAAAESTMMKGMGDTKEPIDIKSDTTEFRGKENIVIFAGAVTAVRGNMTITSDRLEVLLEEKTREVKETRAIGNVSIRREDVLATGGKAIYIPGEDKVTLTEAPKIWRGADAVEGDTVILHLTDDRMEVKGQARVILNPKTNPKVEKK